MKRVQSLFDKLTNDELINSYNILLTTLKRREIIRTNNLVGDLGEFLAVTHYKKTRHLPTLIMADANTKAYDAYESKNVKKRYAIKSVSKLMTGIFWGLEPIDSKKEQKKIFEYVIVMKFDKDYGLQNIYQINWNQFLQLRSWHSTTKAWKIGINKRFKEAANQIL